MSKTTINNIDLNIGLKTEYTINGNKDLVIKLNTSDMGIISRLDETIPKLNDLESQYAGLFEDNNDNTEEALGVFTTKFKELDKEARDIVNYLFDYDICSVCASCGTMFDLQDGEYRFAVIIETLLNLYTDTIQSELDKRLAKMKKRTEKYVNRDHKRKGSK